MLNWLNRKKSSTTAPATAHTQPPLADWRNRENAGLSRHTPPGPERLPHRRRKLKALEVFSLAVVISLIVGVDIYIFGINKRLNTLENDFVEVKTWAFPASLLEGKYASLNARLRALTESFSGLDARLTSLAAQQQPVTVETRAASHTVMVTTEADIPSEAPAAGIARPPAGTTPESAATAGRVERTDEETPATVFTSVVSQPVVQRGKSAGDARLALHSVEEIPIEVSRGEPATDTATPATAADANPPQTSRREGRWVINLLSDPNKALAERFAARARDRGVPVEENRSEVKGRVFWRVQITGFGTASEARAHAEEVKAKLRLKDVWIFKQQG
ncbi:MAG: SPOR domain-containing protein [Gammaproteobacteria bacterium]